MTEQPKVAPGAAPEVAPMPAKDVPLAQKQDTVGPDAPPAAIAEPKKI